MAEQLVFAGFEGPPAPWPTDGLFLAFVPPAAERRLIGQLTQQCRDDHGLTGKPLSPSCLHVSLHGLGAHRGLPRTLIDLACTAAATVSMPPFDITFDCALSFDHKKRARPFVLRVGGSAVALIEFHRALGGAMTKAGLGRWVTRHFTPHMTLLYDVCLVPEQSVEPIGWTVNDFVLVHSLLRRGRHIHLARWPVRG